MKLTKTRVAAV